MDLSELWGCCSWGRFGCFVPLAGRSMVRGLESGSPNQYQGARIMDETMISEKRVAESKDWIKGAKGDWEIIIGLEVHAQVTAKSKLFSGSSAEFGGEPNDHVS